MPFLPGVSRMTAPLRDAQERIVYALQDVFGSTLHSAILKGSAIKGDFIPFYSDLDIHAFLRSEGLMTSDTPRLDLALRFQQAIGGLEPETYGCGSFQVIFLPLAYPADWGKPAPGTYRVLCGDPASILGDVSGEALYADATRRLDEIPSNLGQLVRSVVDKPDHELQRQSRLIGIFLKGAVYNAAVVIDRDALNVWRRALLDVLPGLEPVGSAAVNAFFSGIQNWPQRRGDVRYHRMLVHDGLQALADLASWWTRAQGHGRSPDGRERQIGD